MWAAAPVSGGLWALGYRLKLSRSIGPDMHYHVYCAGTAPRDAGILLEFHGVVIGHKLESLILAQNERWRHA